MMLNKLKLKNVEELNKIGGIDINDILKIYGQVNNGFSEIYELSDDYGVYLVPFDIKNYIPNDWDMIYFGGSAPEKPKNLKNGVPMNWDNENI